MQIYDVFVIFGQVLASLFWFVVLSKLLIYLFNIRPLSLFGKQKVWSPSPNNWAVVTGGTDGIGLAYVRQLASKGYPVLIISRSLEKLNKVKQEIEQNYSVCPQVKVLAFDFGKNNLGHYDAVERALDQLSAIDVLVNNVGISFQTADFFTLIAKRDPYLCLSMININIVSVIKMTSLVLPRMKIQGRGVLLNISSLSALSPIPLLALYSATKAFVNQFTAELIEDINNEGYTNIIIQNVMPGFVSTKMSHLRPSWKVPSADDYVASALKRVGHTNNTYGYWWHSIMGTGYQLLQVFGQRLNSKIAFHELLKLRSRYYRIKNIPDPFKQ